MNKKKIIPTILSTGLLTFASANLLHAGSKPVFNITPTTPTSFLLPANSSETVQYSVTNQTRVSRTLTMQPIAGVIQTSEGCTNPFVLAPQQSCLLTLQINGSQIPSNISGGPIICKTQGPGNNNPDPFLCSQPAPENILSVSVIGAIPTQQAYVTNWLGNSISLCDVNSLDGSLTNCAITAGSPTITIGLFMNPEAIALNPDKTLLYVANISAANMSASTVSFCQVDSTSGALSNCANTTGGPVNGADGISINSSGTLAYVSNAGNDTVSVCQIDSITGVLSNACTNSGSGFHVPSDMTLNALGTRAYVSNLITSSVTSCAIDDTGLLNCDDITLGFNAPEGITLHPSGQFAYITNNGNNTVSVCQIDFLSGHLSSCAVTGGQFDGFGNLAFNSMGTRAYIPRFASNKVSVCSVNLNTGALSSCRDSNGSGFNGPSGILLK